MVLLGFVFWGVFGVFLVHQSVFSCWKVSDFPCAKQGDTVTLHGCAPEECNARGSVEVPVREQCWMEERLFEERKYFGVV